MFMWFKLEMGKVIYISIFPLNRILWRLELFFFFFVFLSFWGPCPVAYGSPQARGITGAVAAGLIHSHSNARCEPLP